jgi:hypothetical protein
MAFDKASTKIRSIAGENVIFSLLTEKLSLDI